MGRVGLRAGGRAACLAGLVVALLAAPSALALPHLPPETTHGPADQLDQYPTVSLATPAERRAAQALLDGIRDRSGRWLLPADARREGYRTRRATRKPGDDAVHFLHAERRARRPYLDPDDPKAIIYASIPGQPLVLVGVMFSLPRGKHGPTPGGPITRWHTHAVCMAGEKRGRSPGPGGVCPPGTTKRYGSEMLHVWLTDDLRSAFAIHAPIPELCAAALVPTDHCDEAPSHPH